MSATITKASGERVAVARAVLSTRFFDTDEEVFEALDEWLDDETRARSFTVRKIKLGKICSLIEGCDVVATGRGRHVGDAIVAALTEWDMKQHENG